LLCNNTGKAVASVTKRIHGVPGYQRAVAQEADVNNPYHVTAPRTNDAGMALIRELVGRMEGPRRRFIVFRDMLVTDSMSRVFARTIRVDCDGPFEQSSNPDGRVRSWSVSVDFHIFEIERNAYLVIDRVLEAVQREADARGLSSPVFRIGRRKGRT
jgi:hypothetical protein